MNCDLIFFSTDQQNEKAICSINLCILFFEGSQTDETEKKQLAFLEARVRSAIQQKDEVHQPLPTAGKEETKIILFS